MAGESVERGGGGRRGGGGKGKRKDRHGERAK